MSERMAEKYPEHAKLSEVSDLSQAIGEFLDWVSQEHGASLAVFEDNWHENSGCMVPLIYGVQDLLAEHFNINLNELEREKRRMLDEIRTAQ